MRSPQNTPLTTSRLRSSLCRSVAAPRVVVTTRCGGASSRGNSRTQTTGIIGSLTPCTSPVARFSVVYVAGSSSAFMPLSTWPRIRMVASAGGETS